LSRLKALRAIPGVGASIAAKIAEYWPLEALRAFLRKGR